MSALRLIERMAVASVRNLSGRKGGLMPHVTMLRVYDNSAEADLATGQRPTPELVLAVNGGAPSYPRSAVELATIPDWAKPLVARAFPSGTGTDQVKTR